MYNTVSSATLAFLVTIQCRLVVFPTSPIAHAS